jgi:hypothetical protein
VVVIVVPLTPEGHAGSRETSSKALTLEIAIPKIAIVS